MKRKIQKRILGVLAAVLLVAGVVYAAKGYQEGNGFHPFSTNRELRNDQLLLPDDGDSAKSEQETDSDDSFWKDDQAEDDSKDFGADSGYLFQQTAQTSDEQPGNAALEENVTPADNEQGGDTAVPTTDVILDVRTNPGDAGDADVVIPGTARPGDKSDSDQTGGNRGDSSSKENDSNTPGKGQNTSDPGKNPGENENPTPSDPGTDTPGTPDDPDTPNIPSKPNYADTAKDPEDTKGAPSDILWNSEVNTIGPNIPEVDNVYVKLFIQQSFSNKLMYAGQSVSEKTIYCALDTYVLELDKDDPFFGTSKVYYWGEDNYGKDKLFYISGVSFDGGQTYETAFPVTIPKDIESGQMKIRIQYRYDTEQDWTEMIVDYEPSATRVYVLSQALEEEHQTIDASTVMNSGSTAPAEGSNVNLYEYQTQLLEDNGEQLQQLFPGWTEYGERVPFLYKVTNGRHVLEPEELADYDTVQYDVRYRTYGLHDDGTFTQLDPSDWQAERCSLQTLVNYSREDLPEAREVSNLEIPDGVQAVDFDGIGPRMTTDWLEFPGSVVYVNTEGTALTVEKGYRVAEENTNYSSDAGLLYNKEKTAILGVPSGMTTVTIPENVTSVTFPENNSIDTVILEGKSESYEELDYDILADGTKFVLDRETFFDFLTAERSVLTERDFHVAVTDLPTLTFSVQDGLLLTENGCIYAVLSHGEKGLYLSDAVTEIENNALEAHKDITTVVMPQNGNVVKVDEKLFENSTIDHILCYSRKQYNAVMKQAPGNVEVSLLVQTEDGFVYFQDDNGVVLTQAPATLTEFNGDELGADTQITAIGDRAFTKCKNLVWVRVPETTETIGAQAFENCTALQGVLISGTGRMTIGSDAFENCPEMRFLASNAMEMNLLDDYVPVVNSSYNGTLYSYMYAPTGGTGYPKTWGAFAAEMNVDTYVMEKVGDSRILYGCDLPSEEGGEAEGCWIALRAGKTLPEKVELPSECYWINIGAFAETQGETDAGFTINWNDLVPEGDGYWMVLSDEAFTGSALAGEAAFPRGVALNNNCLKDCSKLESINIGDYLEYIGKDVFVNDSSLKNVVMGRLDPSPLYQFSLQDYQFNGCDSLETIAFPDMDPLKLSIMGQSDPYRFNGKWTEEEEADRLRLIVSDWDKETYLKTWKYTFAGYTETKNNDATETSAYDNMRLYTVRRNQSATTEEIDTMIAERLLTAENRLRKMLGMEQVDQPTDLYNYEVDSDGIITLTSVYTDAEFIWLDPTTIGLPDGWYLDYIGSGAFKHARNLKNLMVEDNLVGIYSGAFAGASNAITLTLMSSTPLQLKVNSHEPFDFSGLESVLLWGDDKTTYFESWKYPAAGYTDYDDLYWAVYSEIIWGSDFDPFGDIDYDALNQQIAERMEEILAPYEAPLRKLLGISEPEDGSETETEPDTDTEEIEGTEEVEEEKIESETDVEQSEATDDVETMETESADNEAEPDIEESEASSEEDTETKEEPSAESEQSGSAEEEGEMTEEEP